MKKLIKKIFFNLVNICLSPSIDIFFNVITMLSRGNGALLRLHKSITIT